MSKSTCGCGSSVNFKGVKKYDGQGLRVTLCVLNYGLIVTCLLLVLYIIFKDD